MSNDLQLSASAPGLVHIPAVPPGVRLATLENGLTIIVREDHSAPVVSAQAWCRAGSIDEGKWLGAGLSHVLEHMLFKGTVTRGSGRIDQEVQEAGGSMNAYTSFDRTVYWINVPNTGGKVAIDVLCDIMQNATLPEDELAKEMDVIRREMDMCHDDPGRRAGRRLFETAFTQSPYRYTVIGYPDVFNRLKREDIVAYYQEKYAPNNLFLVVAGDVRPLEVIEQIKAAFARSKGRPLPPVALPVEPRQIAPREICEEASIELVHAHFCWHTPDVRHPDVPILDVLAVLLGGGRSSRLYQEVREKKALASSVDAWTYNPGAAGLFGMSAMLEAGKFEAAQEALLEEVERMRREPVAPAELAKAVKQFVSATLAIRKTMQGQAQDLGSNWMAAGDLNFSERYLAAVKRITPEDLQRVAIQYLTTQNRTQYALVPTGAGRASVSVAELVAENPIQKIELPNGLRLLLKEDHRLPFVESRLVLRGGVLAETAADSGLTQLMVRMLLQGTTKRTAEQIVTEIESLGGHIDTYGGNNSFGINLEVLSTDFDTGLALLSEVLLDPIFPEEALDRERQIQLAALRAQKDQILQTGVRLLRRTLFGDAGYGLDPLGSEISLARLGRAELTRLHRQCVLPENAVLAIYGDIDMRTVKEAVERALARWHPKAASGSPAGATASGRSTAPVVASQQVSEMRDKKQAVVLVGFPGATLHDPDRFALELLQEACSDLGSRLFLRIREKLGLAYYVGAQNFLGLEPGYFAFYAGTEPDKADQVREELVQEASLLRTEGLTEEELRRSKAKIIGQKKISRQELGSYAQATALDELYGLGYRNSDEEDARFEAVTLEQVISAARKYLPPEACVIAVVRPEDAGTQAGGAGLS